MTEQEFDELNTLFDKDPESGMAALVQKLADSSDHHALFRAKVLAKRQALNLPLLNPGSLKDAPPEEIISGAITFAGAAAETAVPLIRSLIK